MSPLPEPLTEEEVTHPAANQLKEGQVALCLEGEDTPLALLTYGESFMPDFWRRKDYSHSSGIAKLDNLLAIQLSLSKKNKLFVLKTKEMGVTLIQFEILRMQRGTFFWTDEAPSDIHEDPFYTLIYQDEPEPEPESESEPEDEPQE